MSHRERDRGCGEVVADYDRLLVAKVQGLLDRLEAEGAESRGVAPRRRGELCSRESRG